MPAANPFSGLAEPNGAGAGVEIPDDVAITAFGESLITAANAAAGRVLLGVVPGTDVQPQSAALTSIAALVTAADRSIYTTASNTYAVYTLTAVGRTLVGQATQALMRTTGLGATTIGDAMFVLANPSAVTFPRFNADNSITARTAVQLKTDLSLTIGTNVQAWSADLDSFVTNASWAGSDLTLGGGLTVTASLLVLGDIEANGNGTFLDITVDTINGFSLSGTGAATYTMPTGTQTLVGLTASQTLTNKTLTSPVINAPGITGGQALLLTGLSLFNATTPVNALFLESTDPSFTASRTLSIILDDGNRTLRMSGNIAVDGEFLVDGGALTLGVTGPTVLVLPLTGTLATLAGTETLTAKTLTTPTISGTAGSTLLTLTSVAGGTDPSMTWLQDRTGTVDATPTVIATITIPASTTLGIIAHVVARRTGGAAGTSEDGAFYEIKVTYKNVAGTATIIGSATITAIGESQAGWDVTLNPTSNTVQILGTGAVDNNCSWICTAQLYPCNT